MYPLFLGPCFLNWIQGLFLFVYMFCKSDRLQYLAGYRLSRTNEVGLAETNIPPPFFLFTTLLSHPPDSQELAGYRLPQTHPAGLGNTARYP